jgi:hypothetical protein
VPWAKAGLVSAPTKCRALGRPLPRRFACFSQSKSWPRIAASAKPVLTLLLVLYPAGPASTTPTRQVRYLEDCFLLRLIHSIMCTSRDRHEHPSDSSFFHDKIEVSQCRLCCCRTRHYICHPSHGRASMRPKCETLCLADGFCLVAALIAACNSLF